MNVPDEVVSTWFGAFLARAGTVVAAYPAPADAAALAERMALRRAGATTPEEDRLLAEHASEELVSADRRLRTSGRTADLEAPTIVDPGTYGFSGALLREAALLAAERGLEAAWDPSVHVEEAVRSLADLDATINLLGERLVGWASRDVPPAGDHDAGTARQAARSLTGPAIDPGPLGPPDPALGTARRALAELYLSAEGTRRELESAIETSMPRRAANLTALLGPLLAARLISHAGGLDRLARLPASTIQVLGAEKAFFEHLRGRAPPPRHGLLFLHPTIQEAPRRQRGRLARALAGKAAIAARLDRAGSAVLPELARAYEARSRAIRSGPAPGAKRARSLRPPLDRAADDR